MKRQIFVVNSFKNLLSSDPPFNTFYGRKGVDIIFITYPLFFYSYSVRTTGKRFNRNYQSKVKNTRRKSKCLCVCVSS